MANNIFISAAEADSGKVLVSLGIMAMLERNISRVGFYRPIARSYQLAGKDESVIDRDIHLMHEVFQLDVDEEEMSGIDSRDAEAMVAGGREADMHERIFGAYKKLEEQVDFVVCEGTDFVSTTSSVEEEINGIIAQNLNAPVLLVVDGASNDPETIFSKTMVGYDSFRDRGCQVIAVVVNKVAAEIASTLEEEVAPRLKDAGLEVVAFVPNEPQLAMPRMDEVAAILGGQVLFGRKHLPNKVHSPIVASGSVETIIPLLDNRVLLVTHVDRHDVILMAYASLASHTAPNIGGIVLSGEREIAAPVMELLRGLPGPRLPIVQSKRNTFQTVQALSKVRVGIEPSNQREIDIMRHHFERHVDIDALRSAIQVSSPAQMTPTMFKYQLIKRARADKKHIVLPEGSDERILRAADVLLRQRAVDLTILGNPDEVRNLAGQLALDLNGVEIIDPHNTELADEFAAVYQEERAHKGITLDQARDLVVEPPYFGTLMVHTGRADGMVAGATHSTALTVRPALQLIKTKRGFSVVSSVFFMCLEDRVLVYGDCAVNPDPNAAQLAEIAIASAETAAAFGIDPIIAMLSYSTGESGSGADVDKVKEAVQIAKERAPELTLEGPLQYDAAVDVSVAKKKLPGSQVGGRATVFIFPDLNTGNNTYKAVQRSAGAVAVGPVLQGLNRPVNDLSRGCLVEDIVNTVAITALQAQAD